MDKFKENQFKLESSEDLETMGSHTFLSAFYRDYYKKNKMNLKLKLSSKRMSERVSKLMDTSDTITNEDIINAIKEMELDDLEELKTALIEREIYFRKFKKDKIENIIQDFKSEGYSEGFLKDLENGLKKSSVYNGN